MSLPDKIVYRSRHADVLKVWDDAHSRAEEVGKARRALLDELGFEGRPALIQDVRIVGVQHLPEHGPTPEGWLKDRRADGAIVPDRRRKLGKDVAKKFEGLSMPDLHKLLPGGMPHMAWELDGNRVHWAGLKRFDDAVYVTWACDPEEAKRGLKIDPEVWERIKLSEYYAVLETREEDGGS